MNILGIETSCDETAAAVLQGELKQNGSTDQGTIILSNVIASSSSIQQKYGGVIPEQAAREQLKAIIPVISEALELAKLTASEIDAIAVTQGPGLIGSLLIGVETAKTLALAWNKPLVPINHLVGHFYANWCIQDVQTFQETGTPSFPCIGLLVSGGHSDIVLFKDHNKFTYLGGTRDDAAGECFDKSARLLGIPYPGGPLVAKYAHEGNPKAFDLPRPLIGSKDFDFSFSGLKTAVVNKLTGFNRQPANEIRLVGEELNDFCASLEMAIVDCLCKKTVRAAYSNNIEQIIVSGGVAANQTLKRELQTRFKGKVFIPQPSLCTDNAVMIACCAFYNFNPVDPLEVQANPNLSLN